TGGPRGPRRLSVRCTVNHREETMSNADIIRAWKDPEYRSTLSVVPSHPAGLIELADPDLGGSAAAKARGFRLETIRHITTSKGGSCKTFDCTLSTHHKCCP